MGRGVEGPSLVTPGSAAASIAALVALLGCTPVVTLASGGRQHTMSEADAQYAGRLVEKEPGDQVRLCAYWRRIAESNRQEHTQASGLSGWIDGRRGEVCSGIRAETVTSSAAGEESPGASTTEDLAALEPVLQKLKTISDAETSSGECDQKRRAELQSRLNESRTLPNLVNKFHELRLLWHRIQPLSPDGSTFIVPVPLGGTLHVFALGYSSLDLRVASEGGDVSALTSPYVSAWPDAPDDYVAANLEPLIREHRIRLDASRLIELNSGENLVVQSGGRGCALMAVYQEI